MSEQEIKHTGLPWILAPNDGSDGYTGIYKEYENGSQLIADASHLQDAEFIVRACNSHYELLEILKLTYRDYLHFRNTSQTHAETVALEITLNSMAAAIAKAESAA